MTGEAIPQYFGTYLAAGTEGQIQYLRKNGFTEPTHTALLKDVRNGCSEEDNHKVQELIGEGHVINADLAEVDAKRLLRNPRVWSAVEDLSTGLLDHGRLASREIKELLASHRLPDVIAEDGIRVWRHHQTSTPRSSALTSDQAKLPTLLADASRVERPEGQSRHQQAPHRLPRL